ncbi:hypothetical protein QYM36_018609 [Artemia franciscana]|uniref:Reverse transcriptase domain-containing protein n=1 Tax=Artemia franciscana TaxID=6661 RepID=A0AA88H3Q7_ARTSF|nr:hypothetical protein QYM36_018609 [Artemia franciscana]
MNFLAGRTKGAKVDGHIGTVVTKVSGDIPQGSVIGPLLFNLFANNLPDNITSDIALYADDTKLFRPIKCPNDIQELWTDLNKIAGWMKSW